MLVSEPVRACYYHVYDEKYCITVFFSIFFPIIINIKVFIIISQELTTTVKNVINYEGRKKS
jgi:hypothetical protein